MEKELGENSPDWVESPETIQKSRHLCWLYETDKERLATINLFLGEALARRKQCLLVVTEAVREQILVTVQELNLNFGQYLRTEQIISIEPENFFFSEGRWDIDQLVSRYSKGPLLVTH